MSTHDRGYYGGRIAVIGDGKARTGAQQATWGVSSSGTNAAGIQVGDLVGGTSRVSSSIKQQSLNLHRQQQNTFPYRSVENYSVFIINQECVKNVKVSINLGVSFGCFNTLV